MTVNNLHFIYMFCPIGDLAFLCIKTVFTVFRSAMAVCTHKTCEIQYTQREKRGRENPFIYSAREGEKLTFATNV